MMPLTTLAVFNYMIYNLVIILLSSLSLAGVVVAHVADYGVQRSGMAKLANKFVPECHEHANCARLSVAKEWTQGACEWTRRLYRKKPCQFGRGAVPPPRTAIPLLYAVPDGAFRF